MASRLQAVYDHLKASTSGSGVSKVSSKSPDDVVVTAAYRTALCKAKKGQFKDTTSDELLLSLFKATRETMGIDPALIQDICLGTVLTENAGCKDSPLKHLHFHPLTLYSRF